MGHYRMFTKAQVMESAKKAIDKIAKIVSEDASTIVGDNLSEVLQSIDVNLTSLDENKVNLIKLSDRLDFDHALTIARVGDIIVNDNDSIEIVCFKTPNDSARTLHINDDECTLYTYEWNDNDGQWDDTGEYYLASTDYVDTEVNKKVNLITLTGSETLLSKIANIHKGDIVKEKDSDELAYFCTYESSNAKGFINVDDTGTLTYSLYTKAGNTWSLDTSNSWDFNPADKGTKLYKHSVSLHPSELDNKIITFVSKASTQITDLDQLEVAFNSLNIVSFLNMYDENSGETYPVVGFYGGDHYLYYINGSGIISTVDLYDYLSYTYSDTVTPL